ncbi:hypothetical protein T4C_9414, partial [Trichinella pseudospiralis]
LFLILLCPSLHGGMHNERAICIVALKKNLHKGVYIAMSADGMSSTIILLFNTIYSAKMKMNSKCDYETVFQMYNNVHIILGKTEQKVSFILYNSLHLYKTSSKVISLHHVVSDGKLDRPT